MDFHGFEVIAKGLVLKMKISPFIIIYYVLYLLYRKLEKKLLCYK